MKNRNTLVSGIGFLVLVAAVAIWTVGGDGDPPAQLDGVAAQPANLSGMVVHIDPATGEPIAPPAGAPALPVGDGADSSLDGLKPIYSPVPGVAPGLDTHGRFMNAVVVTTGADSVTVECVTGEHAAALERAAALEQAAALAEGGQQ